MPKKSKNKRKEEDWPETEPIGTLPIPPMGLERNTNKERFDQTIKNESSVSVSVSVSQKVVAQLTEDGKMLPMWVLHSTDANAKTKDIHVYNFTLAPPEGGADLIKHADLSLVDGHRYGFVGKNGTGKSCLLNAIAKCKLEDFPKYIRVLIVEQEARGTNETVLNTVLRSDDLREALLYQEKFYQQLQEDENPEIAEDAAFKLEAVYEKLNEISSFNAEGRASMILQGLGFTREMTQMSTNELSGGWLMRVNLASALFVEPDLLLLDEPTNHLDFPTVLWLEDYLMNYKKTLIVVSHDRKFLDAVATDVMFLHKKKLTYYKGNFNMFEKVRAEQLRCEWKAYEKQQKERKENQEFIARFQNNVKQAAMVQARLKLMEKMEVLEAPDDERKFHFQFPVPEKLRKEQLILLDNISFFYSTTRGANGVVVNDGSKIPIEPLFANVTLYVDVNSRIGVLGANGAGKSTLIKVILGAVEPQVGTVTKNESAIVSCFTQHHVDQLDLTLNPMEYMVTLFPEDRADNLRAHLGRMGLHGNLALQVMGTLSGGQKSRVAFAAITFKRPHLLILDEPTNHLDMETIDALIAAVVAYEGGVIIVSHDLHFLSSVATSFWAVGQGKVKVFDEFDDAKRYSYTPMKKKAAEITTEAKALIDEKALVKSKKIEERKNQKILEKQRALQEKDPEQLKREQAERVEKAERRKTEMEAQRLATERKKIIAEKVVEAKKAEENAIKLAQSTLNSKSSKSAKAVYIEEDEDEAFVKKPKVKASFSAFLLLDDENSSIVDSDDDDDVENVESGKPIEIVKPVKVTTKLPNNAASVVKVVNNKPAAKIVADKAINMEEKLKPVVKTVKKVVVKKIVRKVVKEVSDDSDASEDSDDSDESSDSDAELIAKPAGKVNVQTTAGQKKNKSEEESDDESEEESDDESEEESDDDESEEEIRSTLAIKPSTKIVATSLVKDESDIDENSEESDSEAESEVEPAHSLPKKAPLKK